MSLLFFWVHSVSAVPIVNGELESGFDSAVSLGANFGGRTFSACTGNLITPRIVLTAAHCGGDLPMDLILNVGQAFFGPSLDEATHALGFIDLIVHPDYEELSSGFGGSLGSHDFSMLVLAEDAPAEPTLFRHEPMDVTDLGRTVKSVGFGITSANSQVSGIKWSADLTIDELDEMFIISDSDTNPNGSNICSGDSGGPMFHIDEEGLVTQWAVHSWGDQTCTITSGSTRTDLVVDWIYETIETVHGTDDICEANGYYDDDLCTTYSVCKAIDPACNQDEPEAERKIISCSSSGTNNLSGLVLPILLLLGLARTRQQ